MKNSGIDQVRVIRHGMKLSLENFPIEIFEIFDEELAEVR